MEQNRPIKISFNKLLLLIIIGIIIILMTIWFILAKSKNKIKTIQYKKIEFIDIVSTNESITKNYDIIRSYSEYQNIVKNLNIANYYSMRQNDVNFDNTIFEQNNLLVIYVYDYGYPIFETDLVHYSEHNTTSKINISVSSDGGPTQDNHEHIYIFPISKNITNANIKYVCPNRIKHLIMSKAENILPLAFIVSTIIFIIMIIKNRDNKKKKLKFKIILGILVLIFSIYLFIVYKYTVSIINSPNLKPIIYLYPTDETKVKVQLEYKDKITCSYPKYINEWDILAKPDGNLKDLDTDKNLYALYYESERVTKSKIEEEGFVVKGEDSAEFLEEKLKILGLNDRETEEFIVYWLPKLEANKYNYIRFETKEEIEKNMPLEITPNPDTLIRVLMDFKGLEEEIEVKEQQLEPVARKGFVAVEWGGTEIE